MTNIFTRKASRGWGKTDLSMSLGLLAVSCFFIVSGWVSYRNIQILDDDNHRVIRSQEIITALEDLLSTMKDAETGQRGFLITNEEKYLAPYEGALTHLDDRLNEVNRLTERNSPEKARIPDMTAHIHAKMNELAKTIKLRRTQGFPAALAVVITDHGKHEMDALRTDIGLTEQEENQTRQRRLDEMEEADRIAVGSGILTGILGLALSIVIGYLVRRSSLGQQREEWLQTGQVGLSSAMFGDQQIGQLSDNILKFLAEYLDAHVGALFTTTGDHFFRSSTYGVADISTAATAVAPGERLIGQAAKDKRTFVIDDVPKGYLDVGSGLGTGIPRNLIVCPALSDGVVLAVIELGFVHAIDPVTLELLDRVAGSIGVAVRSANDRANLQNLLEETQAQAEELQAQGEELRVSNEELEEQSRALRETQSRLENQQAELEQTNSQLEEQTLMLESQKDDLNRAKADLEAQAEDLDRTSRYKSDFLANMSHELRTPLNSSLILAKLLADNRDGNLTDEQIKYAKTIQAAGNDLLALISDILDLSKIEAGRMEVDVQRLPISSLIQNLRRTFEPMAAEKSLSFRTQILPDAPEVIETDAQRLEQVLKNLLSNAMKFTQQGEVSIEVKGGKQGQITFAVRDTGIGIAKEQQEMIFEAFRQAEGSTTRKFGGTGLGLSISKELTQLLGGAISLTSEPGKGSIFEVTLPEKLKGGTPSAIVEPTWTPPEVARPIVSSPPPRGRISDDRDHLSQESRVILVVEDDVHFARILYDLAHEQAFECLLATTAEEGLALAVQFLPHAVLLDIGLPDLSGLSVLDRLKIDKRTRHIPVHVVSGSDYAQTAMALGAIGYMLKPVKREELVRAFEMLEQNLTQRLRRVLVVEDDPVQLDSMRSLLGSRDVETIGAGSAAKCLEVLASTTVDCMVLDLSLPDASGFSLLETLSQEEAYSFPPVIVYTGRELTAAEEQRLRKYSKSIIVKGVKSPERLLDEVTLFLHQVVADLPVEKQRLIEKAKHRDAALENRLILVVEDDIRNIFALTSILEPRGAKVEIARNGREALEVLERTSRASEQSVDLVLMDIMMPEMDGFTAMREIRKRPEWRRLPIIALTAKAMKNDQESCIEAGANDYIAKPLDVEKLLSLVRVWIPR